MEARFGIINYTNAFFGAFFGFWCKALFDPLIDVLQTGLFVMIMVAAVLLMAVSLHMAGLWKSRETSYTSEAGEAFRNYLLNWVSFVLFCIAMVGIGLYNTSLLLFPAVFGAFLYGWWVVGTYCTLILTNPAEGE